MLGSLWNAWPQTWKTRGISSSPVHAHHLLKQVIISGALTFSETHPETFISSCVYFDHSKQSFLHLCFRRKIVLKFARQESHSILLFTKFLFSYYQLLSHYQIFADLICLMFWPHLQTVQRELTQKSTFSTWKGVSQPACGTDHHGIDPGQWSWVECTHGSLQLERPGQNRFQGKRLEEVNEFKYLSFCIFINIVLDFTAAAAAVKSLQSCLTLCDPIDGSPPGSPVPGILQAGTPEWVAISFSNAWKWKVKVKSLSRVRLSATPWTALEKQNSVLATIANTYSLKRTHFSVSYFCFANPSVGTYFSQSGFWLRDYFILRALFCCFWLAQKPVLLTLFGMDLQWCLVEAFCSSLLLILPSPTGHGQQVEPLLRTQTVKDASSIKKFSNTKSLRKR